MDNIDQGDFIVWKESPISKALFSFLKDRREWYVESLLNDDSEEVTNIKKQIARINLIDDILSIEIEDLKNKP